MRRDDQSFFENPEFQELLERYERSLEEGESLYMDAEDLTDIAEYYMMHAEEEKADACISLAVELHPDAIDPQVFMARQQLFHGNLAAAYGILFSISDQEDREVVFLHTELLLKEKKFQEADSVLKDCLERIEDDRDAFMYDAADILCEYDAAEESLVWALKLQREFPDYPDTNMLLVDIYIKLTRYDEARQEAEKLLDKDAFNEAAWMVVSETYAFQEKCEESLEATEFVLAINEKHPEAMLARASNLFYLNRIEESHRQYVTYLESYPDEPMVLYLDGICLANLERHEEACETLLRARDLCHEGAPEPVNIHLQLSFVLSKLHRVDEALSYLSACHDFPEPEVPIDYNLVRGHILLENERYEEAEACFDVAIKTSANPYDTLLLIGITMGETGHYTKAADIFQSLHDSAMEDAEVKTSPYLAYCHLFLNNRELYLQFLKEAARLNPNTTQFLFSQFYPGIPVSEYYDKEMKKNKK